MPSDGNTNNITEITPVPQSERTRVAAGDSGVVIDIERMIRNRLKREEQIR